MASELRIQDFEGKKRKHFNSPSMSHVTEHPFRAKRRKLDDEPQSTEDVSITSPAQLRDLLVFQQNPPVANKGE